MTEVTLSALWLPIVLSAVAVVFASFLVRTVFPHHKADWSGIPGQEEIQRLKRDNNVRPKMKMLVVALAGFVVSACDSGARVTMQGVDLTLPPGSAQPNLMVTASGNVVLSWHEPSEDGYALRFAIRERDAWSDPRTIVSDLPFFVNWADFPSMVELPDGAWAVHWLEKVAANTFAYHVKMALSSDRGQSWSKPFSPHTDNSPSEHGFVSMAAFGRNAGVLWLDGRQTTGEAEERGPMSLRFTTIGSNGVPGRDVLVDERVCDCCNTSMVSVTDGIVVAYRGRTAEEIRDIAVRRIADGRWSDAVYVGDDNWYYPGCPVNGPALSARGDDVVIAWYSAPEQRALVQVAFSADGGRSFGNSVRVDEGSTLGRVDVEYVGDSVALVTYLRHVGETGIVRARLVHAGGGTGEAWTVAETDPSRRSGFPVVAVSHDKLFFAWTLPGEDGGVRVTTATMFGVD